MRVALRSWRWVIRSMIDAAKFACLINFDLFDYQRFSATTMPGFLAATSWDSPISIITSSESQSAIRSGYNPRFLLTPYSYSFSYTFILAINHITVNIAQFNRSGMVESLLIHYGNIVFLYKRSAPILCGGWFHVSLGTPYCGFLCFK